MTKIIVKKARNIILICKEAIKNLDFEIIELNPKENYILAQASANIISWGNSIEVNIKENTKSYTITVSSESKIPQIGFGRNNKIESDIVFEIKRLLRYETIR